MTISRVKRLFHTVAHLRVRQVLFRVYFNLRPKRYIAASAPIRLPAFKWQAPMFQQLSTSDADNFLFLGVEGSLEKLGWNGSISKLWLYNLHYLDDLNSVGIDSQDWLGRLLVDQWIGSNPIGEGVGWDPYPLSLRIVNLVKWMSRQPQLECHWLTSLATQVQALSSRIEYDILANHLFANGKALVFGGAYFEGGESYKWLETGLRILDLETKEQFLDDGAHFERSPMYHSLLIWDLCDLINLGQRAKLPEFEARLPLWREIVVSAMRWLKSMNHPDGKISFFNDAAFGIAPEFQALESYSKALGIEVYQEAHGDSQTVLHASSGYAVVSFGDNHKAILDIAKIGPDYQPGHAHADTLSFELSLFYQRVFVNSGTSQYGEDAERHRQRSTAAHNTVEIDEENSSEVWAGFRVARRAYPTVECFEETRGIVKVKASHNGYKRLPGKNIHQREWIFHQNEITITDTVTGPFKSAIARLYIHPEVTFVQHGDNFEADLRPGERIVVSFEGAPNLRLIHSTWHPEFGAAIPNQCIEAEFSVRELRTFIKWSD